MDLVIDEGCVDEDLAKHLLRQVLSAIKHVHHINLIHRDLKLENFLLSAKDLSQATLKVIDFGLGTKFAKKADNQTIVGTPMYMAPEVFSGH